MDHLLLPRMQYAIRYSGALDQQELHGDYFISFRFYFAPTTPL